MLLDLLLRTKFPKEHREIVDFYVDDAAYDFLSFKRRFMDSPLSDVVEVDSTEYSDLTDFWFNHYYQRWLRSAKDYYSWT